MMSASFALRIWQLWLAFTLGFGGGEPFSCHSCHKVDPTGCGGGRKMDGLMRSCEVEEETAGLQLLGPERKKRLRLRQVSPLGVQVLLLMRENALAKCLRISSLTYVGGLEEKKWKKSLTFCSLCVCVGVCGCVSNLHLTSDFIVCTVSFHLLLLPPLLVLYVLVLHAREGEREREREKGEVYKSSPAHALRTQCPLCPSEGQRARESDQEGWLAAD